VNNNQSDIDQLIARSLAGETTQPEEETLQAWMGASDSNKAHYNSLKKAFDLSAEFYKQRKEIPAINIDVEWNHFLNKSAALNDTTHVVPISRTNSFSWLRIAASVLLIAVSGFIVNYFIADKNIVIQTAGVTREVILPDGSKVTLNRNSSLSYSPDFNSNQRSVTLKGEAFFDVMPNKEKPFIISTQSAKVQVLGTSFNVQAYDSLNEMEVVVQTGTVKVKGAGREIQLEAGDKGVYSKESNKLIQTTNLDMNFLAWKTRKFIFIETDLKTVVETLNHAYQTKIDFATQVSPGCVVTVTFDQQDIEAILNVLKTTLNLTYRIENGKIIITKADC
jgi:ferric-dicitrate binding protein FerR (iron transport regulator)